MKRSSAICAMCGRPCPQRQVGRRRRYCSRACQQRAYRLRRYAGVQMTSKDPASSLAQTTALLNEILDEQSLDPGPLT